MRKQRGNGAIPGAMRVVILTCLLVAATCGSTAAGEWQSYLEDSFTTTETMFYTGQAGEAFYAIDDDGRYIVDGMNTSSDSLSALTEDLYYYYLEGQCELLRSTAGELAFTGLVFHYNKSIPGKLSYYVFYYYGDGYYGAKRVVGDQVDIIIPLTPTDALDMYGVNILGVDAQGTRFDLYINGRYVDGFTDVRIDGGGFGFYISKYSKSAFDDFKVKVERRGGGLDSLASPAVVDNGNVADDAGGASERGFPDIPRDPNRKVYSWEVGVDKTGKNPPPETTPPVSTPEPEETAPGPSPAADTAANDPEPEAGTSPPPDTAGQDPSSAEGAATPDGVISSASLRSASPPDPGPETTAAAAQPRPVVEEPVAETVKTLDLADVTLPPGEEMMTGTRELKHPQQIPAEERLVVYTLPAGDSGIGESLVVSPVSKEDMQAAAPKLPRTQIPDVGVEYADMPDADSSERLSRYLNDDTADALAEPSPFVILEHDTPPDAPGNTAPATEDTWEASVPDEDPPPVSLFPNPPPAATDRERFAEPEPEPPVQQADADPADDNRLEIADSMRGYDEWDDDDVVVDYRIRSALENSDSRTPPPASGTPEPLPVRVDEERDDPADPDLRPADIKVLDLSGGTSADVEGNDIALALLPIEQPLYLAPTAGPYYSGPDMVAIRDDFTTRLWPESDSGIASYRYFGAAYEINNLNAQTMAISFQEANFSDLEIMLDAEFLTGESFVGFGLAARFQVADGLASYYGLFISESGEFLLLKVNGGREQVLVDWTASPFIQANKANRIGLDLRGDQLTAFINGAEVAAVRDNSIDRGGYAMLVGPGTSARFDNLDIRGYER